MCVRCEKSVPVVLGGGEVVRVPIREVTKRLPESYVEDSIDADAEVLRVARTVAMALRARKSKAMVEFRGVTEEMGSVERRLEAILERHGAYCSCGVCESVREKHDGESREDFFLQLRQVLQTVRRLRPAIDRELNSTVFELARYERIAAYERSQRAA